MNATSLQDALAESPLVRRFYFYDETDSTMNQARRLVAGDKSADHHHGTLLVAAHQTSGRGRHGRTWSAPSGTSLLATIILSLASLPAGPHQRQLSLLAAAVPVAVCRGIARFLPAVRIKYPNDVVVDGRKLGGILLESSGGAVLVGFGVNCLQELSQLPPGSRMPASSLFLETGRQLPVETVLAAIADELHHVLQPESFTHAGDLMRDLCETLGRTICIDTGKSVLTGVARSIEADGTLLLETPNGMQTVYTTDVQRTWFPEAES